MGRKYRERSKTVEEILQEATTLKTRSQVFQNVHTSYVRFNMFYNALKELGYLKEITASDSPPKCQTTEEGLKALQVLKKKSLIMEKVYKIF